MGPGGPLRRLSFGTNAGVKILILRDTRAHLSVYDSASMYRMDWTDDRLQERFDSIDRRFEHVDQRFDGVERRIDEFDRRVDKRFDEFDRRVDKRFDKVDHELGRINSRMDGLMRAMFLTGGGIIAALLGVIATQL